MLTRRVYGINAGRQESDWAIMLDRNRVREVVPGKIYGWRDRLAVRVRYQEGDTPSTGKPQTLIVSFNHAGAQQDFVNLLRQRGFAVGSGDAPLL